MITTHPAVQSDCSHVKRYACVSSECIRDYNRIANRRHRRALNRITRSFVLNPDSFDNENFDAPTLSVWDLW